MLIEGPAAALERLVNHHIQASSAARDRLSALAGKSLAVWIEGLDLTVRLEAAASHLGITVGAGTDEPATATLSATPLTLLRVLRASSPAAFRASGAELAGDAETAEAFSELWRLARPELEEELSRVVGDVLAHEAVRALRRTRDWGARALTALGANTSEYLQEEIRQLPARPEVDRFAREVERLREDADRVAQRVERLVGAADGRAAWGDSD